MEGNCVFVIRRKNNQQEEEIGSFLRRITLSVRTVLDKFDSVILDARGRNISYACDIATSKNLENFVEIKDIKLNKVMIEAKEGNPKKKIIRLASLRIELKRLSR